MVYAIRVCALSGVAMAPWLARTAAAAWPTLSWGLPPDTADNGATCAPDAAGAPLSASRAWLRAGCGLGRLHGLRRLLRAGAHFGASGSQPSAGPASHRGQNGGGPHHLCGHARGRATA